MTEHIDRIEVAVPSLVRVAEAGVLEWGVSREAWFSRGRRPSGCLEQFKRLLAANDDQLARFAREWGVLGFCEHSQPGMHAECPPALLGENRKGDPQNFIFFREKTEDWRRLVSRVRAILGLAKAIAEGESTSKADWDKIMDDLPPGLTAVLWRDYPASSAVELAMSSMLLEAGVTPATRWNPKLGRFELALDVEGPHTDRSHIFGRAFPWPVGSLYQVIALQLAAEVTSGRLVECTRCRSAFDWQNAGYDRVPRFDRSAFCSDWCRREAKREQKAAYKRRSTAKKRNTSKGGPS
jgi:hypothetical protein